MGDKIRDDLEGVVYVEVDSQRRELKAGDDVPEGVELGAHLLAKGDDSGSSHGGRRRGPAAKATD